MKMSTEKTRTTMTKLVTAKGQDEGQDGIIKQCNRNPWQITIRKKKMSAANNNDDFKTDDGSNNAL